MAAFLHVGQGVAQMMGQDPERLQQAHRDDQDEHHGHDAQDLSDLAGDEGQGAEHQQGGGEGGQDARQHLFDALDGGVAGVSPLAMRAAMFSAMTMASSISRPTPISRPTMEIMLMVTPTMGSRNRAPRKDTGSPMVTQKL